MESVYWLCTRPPAVRLLAAALCLSVLGAVLRADTRKKGTAGLFRLVRFLGSTGLCCICVFLIILLITGMFFPAGDIRRLLDVMETVPGICRDALRLR